jgi:hypothetical protein
LVHSLRFAPRSSTPSQTPSGRPRRLSSSANAAELRSPDFGWRRSCTAYGHQLHGSLGSTERRPTLPPYSLDPVHGPGVELRLRPLLLPPAYPRRACSIGFGLFYLVAFCRVFSWPLLIPSFFALRFLDCLSLNVSFLSSLSPSAQLYSLRASATRLIGKHWASPYASSLLPSSQTRARCGVGAFAPFPTAHVFKSR